MLRECRDNNRSDLAEFRRMRTLEPRQAEGLIRPRILHWRSSCCSSNSSKVEFLATSRKLLRSKAVEFLRIPVEREARRGSRGSVWGRELDRAPAQGDRTPVRPAAITLSSATPVLGARRLAAARLLVLPARVKTRRSVSSTRRRPTTSGCSSTTRRWILATTYCCADRTTARHS